MPNKSSVVTIKWLDSQQQLPESDWSTAPPDVQLWTVASDGAGRLWKSEPLHSGNGKRLVWKMTDFLSDLLTCH